MPEYGYGPGESTPLTAAETDGIQAIIAERDKQMLKYERKHDQLHRGSLVAAAGAYADWAADTLLGVQTQEPHLLWPWYESEWNPGSPKDAIRKAAAMLAAALDVIEEP